MIRINGAAYKFDIPAQYAWLEVGEPITFTGGLDRFLLFFFEKIGLKIHSNRRRITGSFFRFVECERGRSVLIFRTGRVRHPCARVRVWLGLHGARAGLF